MEKVELIKEISNEQDLGIFDIDFETACESITRFYSDEEKEEFDNLTHEEKLEVITKEEFFQIEDSLFLVEHKNQIEEILKQYN